MRYCTYLVGIILRKTEKLIQNSTECVVTQIIQTGKLKETNRKLAMLKILQQLRNRPKHGSKQKKNNKSIVFA